MMETQVHGALQPGATGSSTHRVEHVRDLNSGTYVLRMNRGDIDFQTGQYVSVGVKGDLNMREYSVYSAPGEDFLEILVKEVEHGLVSRRLRKLQPGDLVTVEGPFGFFLIDDEWIASRKFYFIATGTGISPFHSFVKSYPNINYTLLHGVRTPDERYDADIFAADRYISCVSREDGGTFRGRVTEYLRQNPPESDALFYLCGNCDMIYESFDILTGQGVESTQLFAEVYF